MRTSGRWFGGLGLLLGLEGCDRECAQCCGDWESVVKGGLTFGMGVEVMCQDPSHAGAIETSIRCSRAMSTKQQDAARGD